MNVDWTPVLSAVITSLVVLIPLATLAIRTWLQVQINKALLNERPTHAQVAAQVDSRVRQLVGDNGETKP